MSKSDTKTGRVARDFTHEDQAFTKGDSITLAKNQFDDFLSIGLVEVDAPAAPAKPADKA